MKIASVYYDGNIGDKYCNNLFWKEHFDDVRIVKTNYTPKDRDDPIIFGGGGYFLDSNMKNLFSEFQKLSLMNVPFGVVGVGDQNLKPVYYHYLAKILKNARLVTVRDKISQHMLKFYGLNNVHFVPDLLWNLKPKPTKVDINEKCCFIPRPEKMWNEDKLHIPGKCKKFDFVYRKKDDHTLWNAHDYDIYEVPMILQKFNKIICSKYHGAIMCLLAGVKTSIVTYGFSKMYDIATEFDLPIWNNDKRCLNGNPEQIKWYRENAKINIELVEEVFGCKRK